MSLASVRSQHRELLSLIIETSRLLRAYTDKRARERGTTQAQWSVLTQVNRDGGLSQVELAHVLEMQPVSLVPLIDQLAKRGLLERRIDPTDRRINRVYLTAAGASFVEGMTGLADAIADHVRMGLSGDIVDATAAALDVMKRNLKNVDGRSVSVDPDTRPEEPRIDRAKREAKSRLKEPSQDPA